MTKKQKILLASYGGGHINIMIPVYRELIKRGYDVTVLALTMAQQKLRDNNIPFVTFLDFIEDVDKVAIEYGVELVGSMELNSAIPHEETVAYIGICFKELVDLHGFQKATDLYNSHGRQIFLPLEFAFRVLKAIRPDILVTTNSPRTEKALVLEASKLKIQTAVICDLYSRVEAEDRLGKTGYGDLVFVPFDKMRSLLISLGRGEKRVIKTGNPALDYLGAINVKLLNKTIRKEYGWEGKTIVLWVKSVFPPIQRTEAQVEEFLMSKFKNRDDVQLIFRLHPNDPRSNFRNDKTDVFVSTDKDPLEKLISCADIVLTVNSTVGLESNLVGKQVCQIALDNFPEKIPFSELGIGHSFDSLPQLEEFLNILMLRKTPTRKYTPCFEVGDSTRSVVDFIEREYNTQ